MPGSASSSTTIKRVGIAIVIERGRFLVGVRGPQSSYAGCDEFPGGKCHPDESTRDCAIRECMEETGIEINPLELVYHHEHSHPHYMIHFDFWRSEVVKPAYDLPMSENHPFPMAIAPFRWVIREELITLKFPAANQALVSMIERNTF
jgi:mutator protein MutT